MEGEIEDLNLERRFIRLEASWRAHRLRSSTTGSARTTVGKILKSLLLLTAGGVVNYERVPGWIRRISKATGTI